MCRFGLLTASVEFEVARVPQRKSDSDIRALRNSYVALREQYKDLEDAHSTLSHRTTQTIATQKSDIATLTRQLTLLQEEFGELKQVAEQRSHTIEELQAQFDDLSTTQDVSMATLADDESWSVVKEELHRQTDYLRTVEAANAKMSSELSVLKQRQDNVEVLKEQKRELERKVRDVDQLREQVIRLEADLADARKERDNQ